MGRLFYRIKPESGTSHTLHFMLNALLPILILVLVRLDFAIIAATLVLLAKWRIFAVKPRHWLSNARANLVDICIGLSVVAFVTTTESIYIQGLWTFSYILWLTWLKPKSKPIPVMAQALLAQIITLVAFYRAFPNSSLIIGIVVTWLICYACARHFLGVFEEPLISAMSNIWAWFGAMMAWVLGHWVIEYLYLPQIALILTVIGYGLATIYYLHKNKKLKSTLFSQLIGVMCLLLVIIIVFSDWQDKTI